MIINVYGDITCEFGNIPISPISLAGTIVKTFQSHKNGYSKGAVWVLFNDILIIILHLPISQHEKGSGLKYRTDSFKKILIELKK